jgi:uncharacterized protein
MERVLTTPAAANAIAALRDHHASLLFYQSGGCCDGSLPLCFADGEFLLGERDVLLGYVAGCPLYIDARQFDVWKDSQITLDVEAGEPEGFSLPAGPGRHFVSHSRICPAGSLAAGATGSTGRTPTRPPVPR